MHEIFPGSFDSAFAPFGISAFAQDDKGRGFLWEVSALAITAVLSCLWKLCRLFSYPPFAPPTYCEDHTIWRAQRMGHPHPLCFGRTPFCLVRTPEAAWKTEHY